MKINSKNSINAKLKPLIKQLNRLNHNTKILCGMNGKYIEDVIEKQLEPLLSFHSINCLLSSLIVINTSLEKEIADIDVYKVQFLNEQFLNKQFICINNLEKHVKELVKQQGED